MADKKEIPEWMQKQICAGDDSKGIRVYYVMGGTKVVCSDVAVKRISNDLIFADGGWINAKDCYLTKRQAMRSANIDVNEAIEKAIESVGSLADQAAEIEERLRNWITT
jgi:hypothetical protein